jgi:tetratricopeptide (TPR) repeat protein
MISLRRPPPAGLPLVYYNLALKQQRHDYELALIAALRANELDVTSLPVYLLLGQLYAENGQPQPAVDALDIFLKYNEGDAGAYALYGRMQFELGNYEDTIRSMNRVISLDRNRRDAYLYRFYANVELGDGDAADEDIDRLLQFYPDLFEFNIALIRVHLIQIAMGASCKFSRRRLLSRKRTNKKPLPISGAAWCTRNAANSIKPRSTGNCCWICPRVQPLRNNAKSRRNTCSTSAR